MSNLENVQELRQALMEELEAGRQVIESLSDEELEEVIGGAMADFAKNNWKTLGAGALGTAGVTSLAVSANAQQRQANALDKQNQAYGI